MKKQFNMMVFRTRRALFAALISFMALCGTTQAAPGDLDTTFDGDGRVVTLAGIAQEVLVQRDGKVIAVGSPDFTLARYNLDGSLDLSFGQNGKVSEVFEETNIVFSSAAVLQKDGKIVVVGSAMPIGFFYYALMRFNPDGSLDSTFGDGGKVLYRPELESYANAVAIQPDGKIVVVGGGNNNSYDVYTLARFKSDGSPDPFPVQVPDIDDGSSNGFFAAAVQSDGKVVLAGARGIVMRVRPNGTRDISFGTNGLATAPFPITGMVIQSDSKLLVSGNVQNGFSDFNFAVARLNTDGGLDTSFGVNGVATADFGGLDSSSDLELLAGGRIVVAGSTNVKGNYDFALAVFNANGVLDTSFGSGGKAVTDFKGKEDKANSVAVQSDGRIVAAGYATRSSGSGSDFALARYFSDTRPPTLSINNVQMTEGNSGNKTMVFQASLSFPSAQTITVRYATGTPTFNAATPGVDYTAIPPTTLTFAPGTTSKIIAVPIIGDVLDEVDERISVLLSSTTNATLADREGAGTIVDDDAPPSVSITGQTVIEGNSGTVPVKFNIQLSAPSGKTVTVTYKSSNDTAMSGSDYVEVPLTTLTFAPGEITKQITAQVKSDTLEELNERFNINLGSPINTKFDPTFGRSTAPGIIINDDELSLSIYNAKAVDEGTWGITPQTFTVRLSGPSSNTVTVAWATANNTAGPADYVTASGTLTFAPGETAKIITVQIKGDTAVEPTETYKVNLSNPTNAVLADSQGVGYIRNDDVATIVAIDEPSE